MLNLKYHRILLVFIFLTGLFPVAAHAQNAYDGQVINKVTQLAIPGVTVRLLKENIGTETNEHGYFSLQTEKPVANDTLQFSSVGYKTFKLPVSAYQPQIFIPLEASNTQLNEVHIADSKIKTIVLGKFSYYDLNDVSGPFNNHHTELVTSWHPLAKLFTVPQANAVLTNIALGRQDFKTSPTYAVRNKFTMFLIHIISQDTATRTPGKVLFTKTISLTDNSKWVNIDLTNDKIIIPGSNFFIAIEWMNIPYNEIFSVIDAPKVARTTKRGFQILKDASEYGVYYQPFLIGYKNENTLKPAVLYTKINNKWRPTRKYEPFDIAISATIHY